MVATAVLYGISAALEIVGLIVTVLDIVNARRRLGALLGRTRFVYGQMTVRGEHAIAAPPDVDVQGPLEQRVENLEQWTRALPQQLATWDEKLVSYLTHDFEGDLRATERTVNHQLDGLREYIEGARQNWWQGYRGPILLVGGVAVGTAANFVALY
ncbi:hypothetical protein ACWCPD_25700 [Streptomyces sp. NPDC001935]